MTRRRICLTLENGRDGAALTPGQTTRPTRKMTVPVAAMTIEPSAIRRSAPDDARCGSDPVTCRPPAGANHADCAVLIR
jgi:hypothetical protein